MRVSSEYRMQCPCKKFVPATVDNTYARGIKKRVCDLDITKIRSTTFNTSVPGQPPQINKINEGSVFNLATNCTIQSNTKQQLGAFWVKQLVDGTT